MAVITPGYFLQEGSHPAQNMRQLVSALVGQDVETFVGGVSATGPGHGLVRSGHLAVSEKSGTPNMSVDVAAGMALITGDQSLAQGVYVFTNDATVNLAIATADATNPRKDLVVAQVRDNDEDAGGNNDMRLAVVTGTPAGSPADPTVPDGCLVLARVEVDALASSIVNADITTLASLAGRDVWRSYSPTLTNITIGNGTQTHFWRDLGDSIMVSNVIVFGSTTAFTGWPLISPPVSVASDVAPFGQFAGADVAPGNNYGGQITRNSATQIGGYTLGTAGLFTFVSATHPFTWATGDTYRQTYIAKKA